MLGAARQVSGTARVAWTTVRRATSWAVPQDAPPLNVVLVTGSTRAKQIGATVAEAVGGRVAERGHALTVIDPRTAWDGHFMRLMEKAYFHYKDGESIPPPLEEAAGLLRSADALVLCTPEYNHTIAPGLTNFMNHFGASIYAQKPSGIATYSAGMWGGARCGVALRAYLSELGCLPVSATLQLPSAWKPGTFGEAGASRLDPDSVPGKALERMLDQLTWHAHAMRAMRSQE